MAPGGFRAQSRNDQSRRGAHRISKPEEWSKAMRKVISIVAALVFGVGAGLGSSELWSRTRVVPYCKVAKNAEAYHMSFIRVKGKVHFGRNGMMIYEDCDPVEALAASVEFEDGPILGPNVDHDYVNEYSLYSPPRQTKTADAIVEGEFDAKASPGCWGPKFRIVAREVELISPLRP